MDAPDAVEAGELSLVLGPDFVRAEPDPMHGERRSGSGEVKAALNGLVRDDIRAVVANQRHPYRDCGGNHSGERYSATVAPTRPQILSPTPDWGSVRLPPAPG